MLLRSHPETGSLFECRRCIGPMQLMVSIGRVHISGDYESLDLSPLRFRLVEPAECAERYEWSAVGISMVMVRCTGSK